MNITEIIKDAFQFPSRNSGRYAIYLLLSVLVALFVIGGALTYALGIIYAENYLIGGMYFIIALLIAIIIAGYHVNIVKSGIELDEAVPAFNLFDNFITGFDNLIVSLFYFIIPTIIVIVVGLDTNLFANAINVCREFVLQIFNVYIMGGSMDIAVNTLSSALTDFLNSLAITIVVALVLYVIFSLLQFMGEARLANTGSLKEALNIFESAKDIKRIGVAKVIIVILLVVVLISLIEIVLSFILNHYPFLLSTLCIIITPYFILVTQRAIGLLYSDIANGT